MVVPNPATPLQGHQVRARKSGCLNTADCPASGVAPGRQSSKVFMQGTQQLPSGRPSRRASGSQHNKWKFHWSWVFHRVMVALMNWMNWITLILWLGIRLQLVSVGPLQTQGQNRPRGIAQQVSRHPLCRPRGTTHRPSCLAWGLARNCRHSLASHQRNLVTQNEKDKQTRGSESSGGRDPYHMTLTVSKMKI